MISPISFEYKKDEGSVSVTLSCDTVNASIYYTTDGTEPTENSNHYTAPFVLRESTLLKIRAFKSGISPSNVLTLKINLLGDILGWTPDTVGYDDSEVGYGN